MWATRDAIGDANVQAGINSALEADASQILAPLRVKLSGAELAELTKTSRERDRRIAASVDATGGEMFLICAAKARALRSTWLT